MKLFKMSILMLIMSSCIVIAQDPNWSLLVYMDSPDLHDAALNNITELLQARTGSNAEIFVQFHLPGSIAWRYRVRNGALLLEDTISVTQKHEQDIVDACNWAFNYNVSQYHTLILWGHGCGILSPTWDDQEGEWRVEHDDALDICTECLRSAVFSHTLERHKAVLLNDKTHDYITNDTMVNIMKRVSEDILHKKLDILGFDCCLGAMFEHAYQVSPYVQYLIGCQNCELPDGFDYHGLGKRISDSSYTPHKLVAGIVEDYGIYYEKHAQKGLYTLAGFDCNKAEEIKELLDEFVGLFVPELNNLTRISALKDLIVEHCVRFCWMPMYTDLHMLLTVIEQALKTEVWSDITQETYVALSTVIGALKNEIQNAVVHNVTGHRMADAHGISIYLPYSHIDSSYYPTSFAQHSAWTQFLKVIAGN